MELVDSQAGGLGQWLNDSLAISSWSQFYGAVAFAKRAGIGRLEPNLTRFCARRETEFQLLVGIDHQGTSLEALQDLLNLQQSHTKVRIGIFHNASPAATFHPKLYAFLNDSKAQVSIGSSNLTAGGLYTNHELSVLEDYDRSSADEESALRRILSRWSEWAEDGSLCQPLSQELIDQLAENGVIGGERSTWSALSHSRGAKVEVEKQRTQALPFGSRVHSAPPIDKEPETRIEADLTRGREGASPVPKQANGKVGRTRSPGRTFLMTLQNTDVGTGQTSPGASRRSPEIFIPIAARDEFPDFWKWDDAFEPVPGKPHILNRNHVVLNVEGINSEATFMVNTNKRDLRIRSEAVRSSGKIGDVLMVEQPIGDVNYDYYVHIVRATDHDYQDFLHACTRSVRNSAKRFGFLQAGASNSNMNSLANEFD